MRYSAEHKQQTRDKVLKEAGKAIRAEGPHNVGVAAVMAKAGLTHGGFYAHFASKDDLVAAAIGQMFEESSERLWRHLDRRPPAEGLTSYIDFYLSIAHRDTRVSGCPLPFLASDAPRLTDASREQIAKGVSRLSGRLAACLAALGRPDSEDEAGSMLSELVGAVSLARTEPDPEASLRILDRTRVSLHRRLGLDAKTQ